MSIEGIGGITHAMSQLSFKSDTPLTPPDLSKVPLFELLNGGDVSYYTAYLEEVLLGSQNASIQDLPADKLREIFLFLLYSAAYPSKDSTAGAHASCFTLLLTMLPYYVLDIKGVCTTTLVQSIKGRRREIISAVRQRIERILAQQTEPFCAQDEWKCVYRLIKRISASFYSEIENGVFVTSLKLWNTRVQPGSKKLSGVTKKFAELYFAIRHAPVCADYQDKLHESQCRLLTHLFSTPDELQRVLLKEVESSDPLWFQKLSQRKTKFFWDVVYYHPTLKQHFNAFYKSSEDRIKLYDDLSAAYGEAYLQTRTCAEYEAKIDAVIASLRTELIDDVNRNYGEMEVKSRRQMFLLTYATWFTSKKDLCFSTLMHMIPYDFNKIDGFCTPELLAAPDDSFASVLMQGFEEKRPTDSWQDLQSVLSRFHLENIPNPISIFASALGMWAKKMNPKPQEVICHLVHFAQFATVWKRHTVVEAQTEILAQMRAYIQDDTFEADEFMLQLIYELRKTDPEQPTAFAFEELAWVQELETLQRPELSVFVDVVNDCNVSTFALTEVNPETLTLACRLVPSLTRTATKQLLNMLDECITQNPDSPCLQLFMEATQVPLLGSSSFVDFLIKKHTPSSLLLAMCINSSIEISSLNMLLEALDRSLEEHKPTVYHQKAFACLLNAPWVKDGYGHTKENLKNSLPFLNRLSLKAGCEQEFTPNVWQAKIDSTLSNLRKPRWKRPRPLLPYVLIRQAGLGPPVFIKE